MPDHISSVQVYPLTGFNNLKAMGSLKYHGVVLRGLRLLETGGSYHLGMPSRKRGERWEDIYFFADMSERKEVLDEIISAYEREVQ